MGSARFALLLVAWSAVPGPGIAQQSGTPASKEGAVPGLKLAAVPDALYAHLPALDRGQGLLVDGIKPGSRAAELGLKPFDVIVAVGSSPVKSGDGLQKKLAGLCAGEREVLRIIRGGKEFALTVASPASPQSVDSYMPPKSLFKPGGPPAVSVEIKPLPGGGMEVNLFYLNEANKMDRRALHGSLAQIERQVGDLAQQGQMPADIHDLVALALKRLRAKQSGR
jgi:membrane-associated protease RseP (regulator of RpoE activity)